MTTIVLATHNPGKVHELQSLLTGHPFKFIAQSEFGIPEAEETGLTFIENALIKARHAAEHTGLPALADDSGIAVDALNGAPGIYSARFAGKQATATEHNTKLLAALQDIPAGKRQASFHCVLVFLRHAKDPTPIIAQGHWRGEILFAPRGTHGFGYDPIFYVPTHQCSAAEIAPAEKQRICHRGLALQALLPELLEIHF